jgi:hypothetical protein
MAWFLIHIREDPFDILSELYVYFPADDMFTTNSEFAINQLIIAHVRWVMCTDYRTYAAQHVQNTNGTLHYR